MTFSLTNGLTIMCHDVLEIEFLWYFSLAAILPGIAVVERSILISIIWIAGMSLIILLARCWDGPQETSLK